MRHYPCWAVFLCAAVCLSLGQLQAGGSLARFTYDEPHMGTRFRILVYAPDQATADQAAHAAFVRIAELDACMSDYKPTSELMRLCDKAGGEPIHVSNDLFLVLTRAEEISRRSEGAFDVTVGPLVRLWRQARRTRQLPDPDKLAQARALVGYKNVRLDASTHSVRLLKAGMKLDLGGIAKGYAADQALDVLKKHGIERALVAAGGDIAVSGPPPKLPGWTIAIAPLGPADPRLGPTLLLRDGAVSTSGDAEQFVVINGKRYSHIVDPRTGLGLVGRMSASVVAKNGITADGLTKVVSILGQERGFPIIEATPGASARLVRKTEKGQEVFTTKNFPKLTPPP